MRPRSEQSGRLALFEAGMFFGLGLACVWSMFGALGLLLARAVTWALS